jgi:hypothetical protein
MSFFLWISNTSNCSFIWRVLWGVLKLRILCTSINFGLIQILFRGRNETNSLVWALILDTRSIIGKLQQLRFSYTIFFPAACCFLTLRFIHDTLLGYLTIHGSNEKKSLKYVYILFNVFSNLVLPFISFFYRHIRTFCLRTLAHINHLTNASIHPSSTHSPVNRLTHSKMWQDTHYQILLSKLRLLSIA